MKRLLPLFVVAVLTAGSALATVPIFFFDNATGQLTIDTQGLTLESFSIAGPSTDGHVGLPNDLTPPGVNTPLFQGISMTGGGAGGTDFMNWETTYFSGAMQAWDQFSAGVNSNNLGVMLFATYVGSVQLSDFPSLAVSYFSTEEDIGTTDVTPEPATLGMLAVGGMALLRRKK